MNLSQEIFAIKLYEMEQQYGELQSRLRICGREDRGKIREELEKTKNEYEARNLLLQRSVETGRSPAVSKLAEAQLEYNRRIRKLLKNQIAGYLHSEGSKVSEDRAEAAALYAEYAIDFATQAMKYALIASLSAMELQLEAQEQTSKKRRDEKVSDFNSSL